jgi:hypothetical protein
MGSSPSRPAAAPYNPALNPYRARHYWPPDLSKLSPKHQFRLERKYKRRCAQKSFVTRPRWQKGTMLANMAVCSAVAVYGVLFMDWGDPDREGFHEVSRGLRGMGLASLDAVG